MARRSLRASAQGIQRFKAEMKHKKWSQTFLAGAAQCSRQTVWSLLAGKAINADIFIQVCELLGLEADAVAEPEDEEASPGKETDIDELVRQVRETLQPFLKNKFGEMKVLDMSHPIGLGDIYTDVNILSRLTGSRRISQAELLEQCNLEDFERFGFSKLQKGERVPGLQAVEQFPRLVILGKPGAGKTTFLKRIATQCIAGQIFPQQVPVFITLKQFTETKQQPNLFDYIAQQWSENGVDDANALSEKLLNQGRVLLLLDGLDEVSQADSTRVIDDIRRFSERFHRNQFMVTCRIAAKEFTLEPFTEVEVADFDDQQIAVFVTKWFALKDPIKTERFLQKLRGNSRVRELATNPLLLTLLCFGFEDSGDFPVNRSELYEAGIDVLLRKWDAKRNIERDQVYRKLSLKRKEDMLSQIAWKTFEAGDYFFKQKDLEQQIREFIENVTGASTDKLELELDSEAVLKSIEAQHGLFVERARGIYSFSHLTFHEYFSAREVKEKSLFQYVASHSAEKSWQEVILLTVEMVPHADELIYELKKTTDYLLFDDLKLQDFLAWADSKTQATRAFFQPQVIRAFYLWRVMYDIYDETRYPFTTIHKQVRDFMESFDRERAFYLIQHVDLENILDLDSCLYKACDAATSLDRIICTEDFAKNIETISDFDSIDSALKKEEECLEFDYDFIDIEDNLELVSHLRSCLRYSLSLCPSLNDVLQDFKNQLTDSLIEDWVAFKELWKNQSPEFISKLKAAMIEYCNIGRAWKFTDRQYQKLKEYFIANQLLANCLNSDCVITRSVREEIEDTLLLPIAEIEKRKSERN
jgi:transcriptional regulator with XRE-family HTH domain